MLKNLFRSFLWSFILLSTIPSDAMKMASKIANIVKREEFITKKVSIKIPTSQLKLIDFTGKKPLGKLIMPSNRIALKSISSQAEEPMTDVTLTVQSPRYKGLDGNAKFQPYSNQKRHGYWTGMFCYWATKSLCYGVIAAATTKATIATGGMFATSLAAVETAATGLAIKTAVTSTVIVTKGTTATMIGVAAVKGAIVGAGATETAVAVTTAAATSGTVGAIVSGIEVASLVAQGVGTAIWWLP